MRVNGILSFLSFCVVCSDDCRSSTLITLKLTSYHPKRERKLLVKSKLTLQDMGSLIKSSQTTVHHFHLPSSNSLLAPTHLIT